MKKLVIFDLDGTLFDTTPAMQACGNFALENLGLPTFSREDYAFFSGGGIEEYVFGILDAAGDRDHKHAERFWKLYLERQESLSDSANRPYDGIPELLSKLKEKGIRLAVLSNKDHATCVQIVEETFGKGVFDGIRGDMGTIPVKPDPAGVFALLEDVGCEIGACLYVGDTQVDLLTGKNAGMDTAAALWGYRKKEQLEEYHPQFMLSHPLEILDLI